MNQAFIRVGIVCEGATETECVKTCLTPHLLPYAVHAIPKDMQGNVSVERTAQFMRNN